MNNDSLVQLNHYNETTDSYDVLYPQTVSDNVVTHNGSNTLNTDLYRYDNHLNSSLSHINKVTSKGTAKALSVNLPDAVLVDGFPLLVTLNDDLECAPTLSFNGGAPANIASSDGDDIPGGQVRGSVIFIVWNSEFKKWFLLSNDPSTLVTKVAIPVQTEYIYTAKTNYESYVTIPDFNKYNDQLEVNFDQTILYEDVSYEFVDAEVNMIKLKNFTLKSGEVIFFTIRRFIETTRRGINDYKLKVTETHYVAPSNNISEIDVPIIDETVFSTIINYKQTILRNTIDYIIENRNKVKLIGFTLNEAEAVHITNLRYIERNALLKGNYGSVSGTYRYALNMITESFTAKTGDVSVIHVPNFNYIRDKLFVIKDNKLLIKNTNYNIDDLGNIILTTGKLLHGDTIYFNILQGAMMDVPKVNVTDANGNGKDIQVNISYSEAVDKYILYIRLSNTLQDEPTLKFIDGPADAIVDIDGKPIKGGYAPGSFIGVIRNSRNSKWYAITKTISHTTTLDPAENTKTHNIGNGNFVGGDSLAFIKDGYAVSVIPHNLIKEPKYFSVTPTERPKNTNIGDVWVTADSNNLYIGNSGSAKTSFIWKAEL